MGYIGLFLSGATLFLNALVMAGKANAKSVSYFNLFVGTLQIIIPFYLVLVSEQTSWDLYNNAGTFLFGLTYLYVGFTMMRDLDGTGLGYFSLWVSIIALFYTTVTVLHFQDYVMASHWFMWAFLWFLFYLSNTLGKNINTYIGKVAFVQSWVTLTIPSLLYFVGLWTVDSVQLLFLIISFVSMVYFVVAGLPFVKAKRKSTQKSMEPQGAN
ncbi:AmiS/UreI family transporter [Peribacillus alkalitolerans]|uniref:AmiS/UreI family transporter n=1 Tax=Peribacillus alkalitolerans TaxID=1550385 RepID=UPI0013D19C30|nr:AmiS/UreI family transporter [Peribacillus alkalitolerans]